MPFIFKEILNQHGFEVELTDQNFAPHELPVIIKELGELQNKRAITALKFSNSLRKLKTPNLYELFLAIPTTVTSLDLSNNNLSIHSHGLGNTLRVLWTRDPSEEEGSGIPTIKLIDLSRNTLDRLGKDAFIDLIGQLPPNLLHIFLRDNNLSAYSEKTLKKALRQLTPRLTRIYLEENNIDFGTPGAARLLMILASRCSIKEMQLCGNNFTSLSDKELWSLILELQSKKIIFSNASEGQLEGTVIIRTDDARMKQALPAAKEYSLTTEYIEKMAREKQRLEAEMQQEEGILSTERTLELENEVLVVFKEEASRARVHSSPTSIAPTASHHLTQKPLSTTLAPPKKKDEKQRLNPQSEKEKAKEIKKEIKLELNLELEENIETEINTETHPDIEAELLALRKEAELLLKEKMDHSGVPSSQPPSPEPTDPLRAFIQEQLAIAKKIIKKEEKKSEPTPAKQKHSAPSAASFWKPEGEGQKVNVTHKQSSPGGISELTAASRGRALSTATTEGLDISYRSRSNSLQ